MVLLCEHNEEGSFGFVLNNFVDIDVDEVMDDLPKLNTRISVGGPVKNGNLYYLHTRPDIPESIEVVHGVFMGGEFERIRDLLTSGELKASEIRFFIGYSGWSPAQLEDEIEADHGLWVKPTKMTSCERTKKMSRSGNTTISRFGRPLHSIAKYPKRPFAQLIWMWTWYPACDRTFQTPPPSNINIDLSRHVVCLGSMGSCPI